MKTETSKSKNKMNKILITGGTGQFGRAAIEFLLKKGILCSQISALVKDGNKALDLKEKGVSIIEGNYNDYCSLLNAFNGIHIVGNAMEPLSQAQIVILWARYYFYFSRCR